MGRQGSKKRKPRRHLPKVQGNPGQLWSDEPTPWIAGGESFQRWIGRAGPRAQESYFRGRRGRRSVALLVGLVAATVIVVASVVAIAG